VTVQPASSRSIVKAAEVASSPESDRLLPNSADSAMEKQPALRRGNQLLRIRAAPVSKRVLNEYCASGRTPLCVERVPLPSFNPPRQTAELFVHKIAFD